MRGGWLFIFEWGHLLPLLLSWMKGLGERMNHFSALTLSFLDTVFSPLKSNLFGRFEFAMPLQAPERGDFDCPG